MKSFEEFENKVAVTLFSPPEIDETGEYQYSEVWIFNEDKAPAIGSYLNRHGTSYQVKEIRSLKGYVDEF